MPSALRGREVAQGQHRRRPGLLQAMGLSTTSCGSIAHPRLPSPIPWGKQRPSRGLGQTLWSSSATYGQTWGVDFEQLGRKEGGGLLSREAQAQAPLEGLTRAQEVQPGDRLMLPQWARREQPRSPPLPKGPCSASPGNRPKNPGPALPASRPGCSQRAGHTASSPAQSGFLLVPQD